MCTGTLGWVRGRLGGETSEGMGLTVVVGVGGLEVTEGLRETAENPTQFTPGVAIAFSNLKCIELFRSTRTN